MSENTEPVGNKALEDEMNLETLDVEVFIPDGATKPDYISINDERFKTYGDALKRIEQYLLEVRKSTDEC